MKINNLLIEGRRDGYSIEQCGNTMTVGELIEYLESFDSDMPVYLNNDNGYTFGSITENSFEEKETEQETE
jgi:hypothetical protein